MAPASGPDRGVAAQCVYCLRNRHLRDEQVLLRGNHFYLCVPVGQVVEGFLAIAPYACAGALARLPGHVFDELTAMQNRVRGFYALAYDAPTTFYEQGRGGGGARTDAADRFPLHAHLCSVPVGIDLHSRLGRWFSRVPVPALKDLTAIVADRPYVYVESTGRAAAYVATSAEQAVEIERARLKPVVAELLGLEGRGDWRAYPGERELMQVVKKWRRQCESRA